MEIRLLILIAIMSVSLVGCGSRYSKELDEATIDRNGSDYIMVLNKDRRPRVETSTYIIDTIPLDDSYIFSLMDTTVRIDCDSFFGGIKPKGSNFGNLYMHPYNMELQVSPDDIIYILCYGSDNQSSNEMRFLGKAVIKPVDTVTTVSVEMYDYKRVLGTEHFRFVVINNGKPECRCWMLSWP